jgi:hypothetical protein
MDEHRSEVVVSTTRFGDWMRLAEKTGRHAVVSWSVADVLAYAEGVVPGMTNEQALAFLENHQGRIQDAMVEAGGEVIGLLLSGEVSS